MRDFNDRFGAFYTVSSVAAWRNCDEADVLRDIDRGVLLAIEFADGATGLPARQFKESADPLPGLASVAEVVGAGDPLAIALFLFTKAEAFDGDTGADWLWEGRVADVLDIARKTYGPLRF